MCHNLARMERVGIAFNNNSRRPGTGLTANCRLLASQIGYDRDCDVLRSVEVPDRVSFQLSAFLFGFDPIFLPSWPFKPLQR